MATPNSAVLIKGAIQKAFSGIGKKNGTAPPESRKNTFPVAYEFFVARELRSAAEVRYKAAEAEARDKGILGTEEDYIVGSAVPTHDNELFGIVVKKANASSTLDKTMFHNNLAKKGWTLPQIAQLLEDSSKPRKGAVTPEIVLKG